MQIIAAIAESAVIEQILTHLGLQADCGRLTAHARAHALQEGPAFAAVRENMAFEIRCSYRHWKEQ